MTTTRMAAALLLGMLTTVAAGCGGSDRPETVPVSGTITLNGGEWPADGIIYFAPLKAAEGYPTRPGSGKFGRDGSFEAQTFAPGDGLIPGTYSVRVESWKEPPTMEGNPGVSYVPEDYREGKVQLDQLVVSPDDSSKSVTYDVSE